jgi:hypothetical protein
MTANEKDKKKKSISISVISKSPETYLKLLDLQIPVMMVFKTLAISMVAPNFKISGVLYHQSLLKYNKICAILEKIYYSIYVM